MPVIACVESKIEGHRYTRGETIPEAVLTAIPSHIVRSMRDRMTIREVSDKDALVIAKAAAAERVVAERQALAHKLAAASATAKRVKAGVALAQAALKTATDESAKAEAAEEAVLEEVEAFEKKHPTSEMKGNSNGPRES